MAAWRVRCVALLAALLIAAGIPGSAPRVAAPPSWADWVFVAPVSAEPEVPTLFTVTVHNGASSDLYVWAVRAKVCGTNASFKDDDGTAVTIHYGGRGYFNRTLTLGPESLGTCWVQVTVLGNTQGQPQPIEVEYTPSVIYVTRVIPPTASIVEYGRTGPAPFRVSFEAVVQDGRAPYTYAWWFGDGSTAAGKTVTHEYFEAGIFAVQLVVTDCRGNRAVANETVRVTPGNQPGPDPILVLALTGVLAGGIGAAAVALVPRRLRRARLRRARRGL